MLRTLRNRLILSHVLPLLIIIPLMGVAIIYAWRPRFITQPIQRTGRGSGPIGRDCQQPAGDLERPCLCPKDILTQGAVPGRRVCGWPQMAPASSSDPTDLFAWVIARNPHSRIPGREVEPRTDFTSACMARSWTSTPLNNYRKPELSYCALVLISNPSMRISSLRI